MKIKSQAGFTLIEGLLILIAITLIGATGFYVYNANENTEKTISKASSASKPKTTQPAQAKYLEIKELGVKLPLDSKLDGLQYEIASEPTTADLNTKSFQRAVADCRTADNAANSFSGVGFITKIAGTYDPNSMPQNVYAEFAVQFDDFYLTYGVPDGGFSLYCTDGDQAKKETVQNLGNQLVPDIKEAVKNAKKI